MPRHAPSVDLGARRFGVGRRLAALRGLSWGSKCHPTPSRRAVDAPGAGKQPAHVGADTAGCGRVFTVRKLSE
jgi:hypothetical protein